MKGGWIRILAVVVILVTVLAILGRQNRARSSTLSTASDGLRLARAWLEDRGTPVELIDIPLGWQPETMPTAELEDGAEPEAASGNEGGDSPSVAQQALDAEAAIGDPAVLVLAMPWQTLPSFDIGEDVADHLRRGGDLVFAYADVEEGFASRQIFDAIGLVSRAEARNTSDGDGGKGEGEEDGDEGDGDDDQDDGSVEDSGPDLYQPSELRGPAPLGPLEWWRYRTADWTLPPAVEGLPPVAIPAFRYAPPPPENIPSTVLYEAPEGQPIAFTYPFLRGRVVVLPATLLHNAHLAQGEQIRLLEWLRRTLGTPAANTGTELSEIEVDGGLRPWRFDEFHHGLVRPELVAAGASSRAWDLLMIHAVVIYLLALLALGRRFGPAWRESVPHQGSAAAFLHGLGELHHRLGHHADAARLLVERLHQWDPRLHPSGAESEHGPETRTVRSGDDLVEFARRLAPDSDPASRKERRP